MCPKLSEKTKGACKSVMPNVKLGIIKHFDQGEQNKDIVWALTAASANITKRSAEVKLLLCFTLFWLSKSFIGMFYFQIMGETCIDCPKLEHCLGNGLAGGKCLPLWSPLQEFSTIFLIAWQSPAL